MKYGKWLLVVFLVACTKKEDVSVNYTSVRDTKLTCKGEFQELDAWSVLITCEDGTVFMYKNQRFGVDKVKVR